MKILKKRNRHSNINTSDENDMQIPSNSILTEDLQQNIDDFKQFTGQSKDVNVHKLRLPIGEGKDAVVISLDGLVDKTIVNQCIIDALLSNSHDIPDSPDLLKVISEQVIRNLSTDQNDQWTTILDKLFSGDTILIIDGVKSGLILETRKWADRGVPESSSEQVVRGSKESFSETLQTNIMLIRRRIKSPKLQMEYMTLGTLTKTDIIISYINGLVNPKLVDEVRERLSRIDTDAIIGSNMIEEYIEDSTFSFVPQILHTERPDKTAAHLLEGGVCILVDGTPLALLAPITFWQFFNSPEDYYERLYVSFLLRSLRYISLIIALALPSFYIAVTTFHQEMIPVNLLQIISAGRRSVPYPILIEVFLMEFIMEILREAGVRLPRNVGAAISIVGALVLGQAGMQAKLASPATVTVVAISAIANFTFPNFSMAISVRVVRFSLMIISGVLGIYGLVLSFFFIIVHLCSLRSFGVSYLAPLSPFIPSDIKDTFVRVPRWAMSERSKLFGAKDLVRQKAGLKPGPNQNNEQSGGRKDE